jgi:Trypsin-like peptidase domain/NB-ARC domain
VRVLRAESTDPAGVGFVVADQHIMTCAHVVNFAMDRGRLNQVMPGPHELVQVDFPILGGSADGMVLNCRVVAWTPPPVAGVFGGDVAALQLLDSTLPPGARPARLMDPGSARYAQVAVFGYPEYPEPRPEGGWARLCLSGGVGGGLIQLDAVGEAAFRAQPGYSGSPVVASDSAGDAVIGILSVASADGLDPDSYAIPASKLIETWPRAVGALGLSVPDSRGDPYGYPGVEWFRDTAPVKELPLAPRDFSGRAEEIQRLNEWLMADHGPRIVNIYGIPGSGKTALALRVAQDIGAQYPDCQLHFNLRSSDQSPVSIETLLGSKLVQLGVPISDMPAGLQARAEAYRSRIAGRRTLIVLDNVTSYNQIELLLPGYSNAAVLVTSWTLIPELGSHSLCLQPLLEEDAVAMLATVSGRPITDKDHHAVLGVARLLGNLPLALRIAGGLMRTRELWTWKKLTDRLCAETASSAAHPLVIGSPEVQTSFDLAFQELKPDTAQAYRLIGLAPSARMSKDLAQALISDEPGDAEDILDQLVTHQLLQPESESIFRMHDLLWLHARSTVAEEEDLQTRQAAIRRLNAWSLLQLRTRYLDHLRSSLSLLPPIPRANQPLSLPETYVESELTAADPADWLPPDTLVGTFPARQERLALMAPGGSGKTTMVAHLCLMAAARYQADALAGSERIPLVVLIRDIRPGAAETDLETLIIDTLRYRYECELTRGALDVALENGEVFVVADGFDELIEPVLRQRVMHSINDFARRYPRVPMLLTTRPLAEVHDAFPGFTVETIAPWDWGRAKIYLEKLAATGRGTETDVSDLLNWLSRRNNLGVMGTPLGLQLLVSRYWYRNDIPETFTLLMEGLIEEITGRRERTRGIAISSGGGIRFAAEEIAFAMQSSSGNRITISEHGILRILQSTRRDDNSNDGHLNPENATSLIISARGGFMRSIGRTPDGGRLFAFPHTAYREHLAASHLARMDPAVIVAVMRSHFTDASWEAVFVAALELGTMWRGHRFPQQVWHAAAIEEPRLRDAIRSWDQMASNGPGSGMR